MINLKIKNVKKRLIKSIFASLILAAPLFSLEEGIEDKIVAEEIKGENHYINFQDVSLVEFIRFVSKISHANFIYDVNQLQFPISFSTGKSVSSSHIVKALIQLLRVHGFGVREENNYYMVYKVEESGEKEGKFSSDHLLAMSGNSLLKSSSDEVQFTVVKLQYHQGAEIQEAIKKIGADLKNHPGTPPQLFDAIQSMQWIKATNSLLCTGDDETMASLKKLISSLDMPLRQVFIEILVIETDVRKGLEFGLQWAAGGEYKNRFGFGVGNFPPSGSSFASTLQGVNGSNPPTGLNQIPVGSGFDLGVIGDIILHKGRTFLTLGSLVSALQSDGDSTIVLNQKIITQDNKNSKIFVGDNIPFPGSVVTTVGQSQQTTANIEYRDIGVSLSITPMVGEGDVITLDIDEEISEAVNLPPANSTATTINGIRSTKTNMVTHVHVPDKHFLVLSGMIRNNQTHHKAGIPCLGGLPLIGALFSKTTKAAEKRNVVIFVRPHLIHSFKDYEKLTQAQEDLFKSEAIPADFEKGINMVKEQE